MSKYTKPDLLPEIIEDAYKNAKDKVAPFITKTIKTGTASSANSSQTISINKYSSFKYKDLADLIDVDDGTLSRWRNKKGHQIGNNAKGIYYLIVLAMGKEIDDFDAPDESRKIDIFFDYFISEYLKESPENIDDKCAIVAPELFSVSVSKLKRFLKNNPKSIDKEKTKLFTGKRTERKKNKKAGPYAELIKGRHVEYEQTVIYR